MGNLIRWLQPDSEYGWTEVRIHRATSKNGTYTLIHTQDITDTSFHDVTGEDIHWYKLSFYNDVDDVESAFSEPIKAEHFKGYATISEVRSFTRVTNKEFDDNTIQTMIDRASDRIDLETARTWRGLKEERGFFDGDDTDILWLTKSDIQEILTLKVDRDYTGRYVDVLVKDFVDGDILATDTILNLKNNDDFPESGIIQIGDELIEYTGKSSNSLTGLTRGYNGTTPTIHEHGAKVWLNNDKPIVRVYSEGYIILTRASKVIRFPARPQSVEVRFLYGNKKIPAQIKHLCLLMVSQMMNIEDPRTIEIDRVLAENKWKGPVGIA